MRDTTPEAHRTHLDAIRRIPPIQRLIQAIAFSESERAVALAGLRRLHPELTEFELVELRIGRPLIPRQATRQPG